MEFSICDLLDPSIRRRYYRRRFIFALESLASKICCDPVFSLKHWEISIPPLDGISSDDNRDNDDVINDIDNDNDNINYNNNNNTNGKVEKPSRELSRDESNDVDVNGNDKSGALSSSEDIVDTEFELERRFRDDAENTVVSHLSALYWVLRDHRCRNYLRWSSFNTPITRRLVAMSCCESHTAVSEAATVALSSLASLHIPAGTSTFLLFEAENNNNNNNNNSNNYNNNSENNHDDITCNLIDNGYRSIDCDDRFAFEIEEECFSKSGLGHCLWDASVVISRALVLCEDVRNIVARSTFVLDIGCGVGLTGIVAAEIMNHREPFYLCNRKSDHRSHSGCNDTEKSKQVVFSDLEPSLVDLSLRNAGRRGFVDPDVTGHALDWADSGENKRSFVSKYSHHFDTILVADCLYDPEVMKDLAELIDAVLANSKSAAVVVGSAKKDRREGYDEFFERIREVGFTRASLLENLPSDCFDPPVDDETITMHILSRK